MNLRLSLFFALASTLAAQPAAPHWVTTWATAQPLIRPAASQPQTGQPPRGFANQTVRMIVRSSVAGSKLRIKLSSPFGATPVTIGGAHIALRKKDAEIVPASDRALTFNGKPSVTLGPGMVMLSDPLDFPVAPQADLAVSLWFPTETGPPSAHGGLRTSYVSKEGDFLAATDIAAPDQGNAAKRPQYFYLESLEVLAPADVATIVTFGDSITEGARSTVDSDHPWPTLLSARLAANKATRHLAVANMGIGGNRVLRDGSGASALARFDRDVISQAGVKWVMLLEGINDIGHANTEPVTADELIGAFRQLIERAHTHGIRVIGCTLTPYEGAGYSRPEGEAMREALNTWIRTSGSFDAVVDFEAATRDPNNPKHLRPDFDPGDHLHPNDAGYQAMADAIDLGIFTRRSK